MRVLRSFLPILAAILPSTLSGQEFTALTGLFQHIKSVSLYGQGAARHGSPPFYGAGTEVQIDLAPSTAHTLVILGLGAGYLQGIEVRRPDLDLHASVRSFPTFSAYVGRSNYRDVEPFARFSFGIADLWNAQAVDVNGNRSKVDAQTVDYGVMGGLELKHFVAKGFFLEGGYVARRFSSINWGTTKDDAQRGWPRHLNLSRFQVAVGFRFHVADEVSKSPSAPALVGAWHLTGVDDDHELPAPMTQRLLTPAEEPKNGSERDEIVDGTLRIDSTMYRLVLFHRVVRLDSGGKPVMMGDLTAQRDSGGVTLTNRGANATLDPNGPFAAPSSFQLERREGTILFRLPGSNHLLTFTKLPE